MKVIDGMHRLIAASLKGRETINIKYFDGNSEDAFLRAVEANVAHGLPLSRADRRAAAARIIRSHPHMSDRAVGAATGVAARTVAALRRATDAVPQLNTRVGKDGRVRPLSSVEGRLRAAQLLKENPRASLRKVAQGAGVSPATARDVRKRLERGEDPAPTRPGGAVAFRDLAPPYPPAGPEAAPAKQATPHPRNVLEKLLQDPSLRHNDMGRRLLRLLQQNAIGPQNRSAIIAAVPAHCAAIVAQLARHNAQMWLGFADELDARVRVIEPHGVHKPNGRRATGQSQSA